MRQVRIRVLGLVFVGALLTAACTAGSASALPEFGRCHSSEAHEGRYTDSNCTIKAKKNKETGKYTGEYEWIKSTAFAANGEYTEIGLSSGPEPAVTTLAATFVKCTPSEEKLAACREGETEERVPVTVTCSERSEAAFFSTKSSKEMSDLTIRLAGCETAGIPCANSVGGYGPEIFTSPLKGVLGYINKATKEVGIDWKPESGHEVAKFSCGGAMDITLGGAKEKEGPVYPPKGGGGGTIATVSPVNQMANTLSETLTINEETDQNVPSSFEGKPPQDLEGWFYNPEALAKGSKWSPAAMARSTWSLNWCGGCNYNYGETEIKA